MPNIDLGSFGKHTLLVGAGFSKNWGGRLASEVWADVFSNNAVQRQDRVRHALLHERSFEVVMEDVLTGEHYDADDRRAIIAAISQTFKRMDELYNQKTIIATDRLINYATLQILFQKFFQGTGYLFTLNQDRLLELLLENRNIPYKIPYVLSSLPSSPHARRGQIPNERPVPLSPVYSGSLNLIKLHGCHTWTSGDGVPVMVIGKQKHKQISGSWLLTEYETVFESVLNSGGVRLLVIGYSFRDEHINKIIGNAVSAHHCKVYVWDPAHPLDTLNGHDENAEAILKGLIGWEPRSIADVMPSVRVIQITDENILQDFFQ